MARIQPIDTKRAEGKAKDLLNHVQNKLGMTPNIIRTMANSPAVLEAYLGFSEALQGGVLPAKLREQIALTVAEANHCHYCLAAHSVIGRSVGLSDETILDSRKGFSTNSKDEAALRFAAKLVENRGFVTDEDVTSLRDAGYRDGEIAEIVANVTFNIFTNYFNHVADPEVDFPHVKELVTV